MNQKQLIDFHDKGFVVIDDIFTKEEMNIFSTAFNSEVFQDHLSKKHTGFSFHLLEIAAMHPIFMELAKNEKILSHVRQLIGNNIQLQHSKMAVKQPGAGSGEVDWHQDFAYFPHTNTDLVAVMIAFDDVVEENGAMQAVKGSHKLGLLEHVQSNGFLGSCTNPIRSDAVNYEYIKIKTGGISLHHCLLLHCSHDNLSSQPRRTVVFEYRADDAFQLSDWVWRDTGVLVSGKRDYKIRLTDGVYQLGKTHRYGEMLPFGNAWNQVGDIAMDNVKNKD